MTTTKVIENTYKISFSKEESSCVYEMTLDYDNGHIIVCYHSNLDHLYYYDCEHSGVLDCFYEAVQDLEHCSIGRILNYYKKSGEMVALQASSRSVLAPVDCGSGSCIVNKMKKLPMNDILAFFTEDEWDAIYNAMADYQDHGEEETELAYSIQSKITLLFN